MIKEAIRAELSRAIHGLVDEGRLTAASLDVISLMNIARAKDKSHGDFACNIAMMLAKPEGKAPRDIAELLKQRLIESNSYFKHIDIAGPGFINLTLSDNALSMVIPTIARRKERYGRAEVEHPKTVLVEFVSANPTGGLHLGHARGAFVGDALSRLLSAAGFLVTKEFYINDVGNQVETLARTIHKRYRELFGETITISSGEYPGDYVKDIAQALKDLHGDRWLNKSEDEWLVPLMRFGVDYNLAVIKRSLLAADIHMDKWYYEHTLHEDGKLEELIEVYDKRHMLYQADVAVGTDDKVRHERSKAAKFAHLQEGGTFLKTSQFGDEEDRIIRRKDGRFVYLTADLAYHHEKYERGFDMLVNVLGGDHAGHVARIKAGMAALGHEVKKLHFVLVQMVRLNRAGQEVRFSKRAGQVVELDDLLNEVGKDVARFIFLMRSPNAQFELDLDLIEKQSSDNPVFYVQYGHARMATILMRAQEQGIDADVLHFGAQEQAVLSLPEERELILRISELEEVVREAALMLEPHRLIFFCHELIKTFHSYFTKYRHTEKIISTDMQRTKARLSLVFAIKITIFNALSFLGIHAPDHMELAVENEDG